MIEKTKLRGHAIIIGAMKSGTTSLDALLRQHPEIVGGRRKELNFFRDTPVASAAAYAENFPKLNRARHAYMLDSSPNYTKVHLWPEIPQRIASLDAPKKLIFILRNPVDRVESHIAHNVDRGRWSEENPDINSAIAGSKYGEQLLAYGAAGLTDILLLDFATLVGSPASVCDQVCDFLNLDRFVPKKIEPRNVRRVERRHLSEERAEGIWDELESDVRLLADRFGFEAARTWLRPRSD